MSKPMLLFAGCLAIAVYQNWWLFENYLNPQQASVSNGSEKVVLYATQWCGYCAKTRRFFANKHIPYSEFDVEKSERGRVAYRQLGGGGVPIIVINGSTVIRGFDPEGISDALGHSP